MGHPVEARWFEKWGQMSGKIHLYHFGCQESSPIFGSDLRNVPFGAGSRSEGKCSFSIFVTITKAKYVPSSAVYAYFLKLYLLIFLSAQKLIFVNFQFNKSKEYLISLCNIFI